MRTRGQLVFGALLLLASGATWWLNSEERPPGRFGTRQPHTADYWIDNLRVTEMGPDGRPKRRLDTREMRHYPDDDSTELTQPVLTVYAQESTPWKVRSETGWVAPDGQLILLRGKVHIDREGMPGTRPVHLTTRDLRIQPKQQYAETDQAVRVTSTRNWVHSVGMQVWFGEPVRIKLLSKVRGRYEVD